MAEKKISEQAASEAPLDPILRRSIQMKNFGNKTLQAEIALAFQKGEPQEKWAVPVGQILGRIAKVEERIFEHGGEMQSIMQALGEFEATVYKTGEVLESPACDLPRYYLEGVKAVLDKGADAVLCGVEIVMVATGKNIPFAYEVRNLIPREANNPINRMKLVMQKRGTLRLPPPVKEHSDDHVIDAEFEEKAER